MNEKKINQKVSELNRNLKENTKLDSSTMITIRNLPTLVTAGMHSDASTLDEI